jgi:polyhydroxyalkanoate synthesis regulator phasin
MTTTVMGKQLEDWSAEWADELKKAGRSLWLATLGLVQTLDEHGREFFAGLVERGERLELPDLGERLRSRADQLRDFGLKAERRLEEGMSDTLERFGVPSRDDVKLLGDRIEELSRKVEGLKK